MADQGKSEKIKSVKNWLEQIFTNQFVKAKDQRLFRQIQKLKREIHNKIKANREAWV